MSTTPMESAPQYSAGGERQPGRTASSAAGSGAALRSGRWHEWACLLPVLLIGGYLRLDGIQQTSVRYCDGSWYAADARVWHRCARVALDPITWGGLLSADTALLRRQVAVHGLDSTQRYAKPSQGYTFLVAAMMFLVGDTPSAAPTTNAWLSTLGVLVAYLLARRFFDRGVAWAAALLLALCPYDVVYARADLADASASFFLLAGACAWVWQLSTKTPARRRLVFTGMLFGYALTCHYRSLLLPLLLGGIEFLRCLKSDAADAPPLPTRFRQWARRCLWMTSGLLIPALCIEAVFQAGALAARIAGGGFPIGSYLMGGADLIRAHIKGESAGSFYLSGAGTFVGYFMSWMGLPFLLLAAIGAGVTFRRRMEHWILWIAPIVTMSLLLFQRSHVARAMACTVPFVCLAAALGAWTVAQWLAKDRIRARACILSVLLTVAALHGVQHSLRLSHQRGDMPRACDQIARLDGLTVVPNAMMYRIHTETLGVRPLDGETIPREGLETVLAWLEERGARYFVTDPQCWHHAPLSDEFRFWAGVEDYLRQHAVLIAEYPHLSDYRWEFLAEAGKTANYGKMVRGEGGPIRIYDLAPVYASRLSARTAASTP
ncbi:MAG: glycosyltransferase family 39 protein [Phycisphaerales bacterium]|nr:glycosyltransferase family 39 protein [Phycisphaerales bacterium]